MVSNLFSQILIYAVPVLFSIVIHEVSHGWMAYKLGDNTAKNMGRLTLNPLVHVDPMGTIVLPLIMIFLKGPVFGWAKPVPFNPYNFRPGVDRRNGTMWVAISGPASNFAIAFVASFVLVISQKFLSGLPAILFVSIIKLAGAFLFINLILGFFNLIPLPPLDGSKILARFIPQSMESQYLRLERYGMLILILILLTGGFSKLVLGPVTLLYRLFLSIPMFLFQ
jgi:Zn-dependent protease